LKALKYIGVGFLVSFLGSLPLGYLNVAGLEMYDGGANPARLISYLLGVIVVEVVIIYLTLIFAKKLIEQKKLMRFIEAFSVVFIFGLAVFFYMKTLAENEIPNRTVNVYWGWPGFLVGIGLSCINFQQVPFWTGWNLYLLNKRHIKTAGFSKYFYLAGTAAGTFCGMAAFIFALTQLGISFLSGYQMQIIALAFAVVGVVQAWKFYWKYYAYGKVGK
jgi:hypothetical protein